jgi:hypothetical protein
MPNYQGVFKSKGALARIDTIRRALWHFSASTEELADQVGITYAAMRKYMQYLHHHKMIYIASYGPWRVAHYRWRDGSVHCVDAPLPTMGKYWAERRLCKTTKAVKVVKTAPAAMRDPLAAAFFGVGNHE